MTEIAPPDGVLAIHLGDAVGWCYGGDHMDGGGVWYLPKRVDAGFIGAALFDALADLCKRSKPRLIVLTGPPSEVEAAGSPDVAVLHLGLLMCVQVFGWRRKIATEVPNVETIREKMLGRAEFSASGLKDSVLSFGRRRGLDPLDVDAAHALVLWEFYWNRGDKP